MKIGFAGDRSLAVAVLDHLVEDLGVVPSVLFVPGSGRASHAEALIERCELPEDRVLVGDEFRSQEGLSILRSLDLDYVVAVHFPYIVPSEVLEIPREGVLNLHPAYLPYNRGWHTPTWAILDGTPAGATLHFMDEGVDTGPIVHRKRVEVRPEDTAHSLYQRIMEAELEVFREAWPRIASGDYELVENDPGAGSSHRRSDLFDPAVQQIRLDEEVIVEDLLRRLRALTTDRIDEAAYFEKDGVRYRVRVDVRPETRE